MNSSNDQVQRPHSSGLLRSEAADLILRWIVGMLLLNATTCGVAFVVAYTRSQVTHLPIANEWRSTLDWFGHHFSPLATDNLPIITLAIALLGFLNSGDHGDRVIGWILHVGLIPATAFCLLLALDQPQKTGTVVITLFFGLIAHIRLTSFHLQNRSLDDEIKRAKRLRKKHKEYADELKTSPKSSIPLLVAFGVVPLFVWVVIASATVATSYGWTTSFAEGWGVSIQFLPVAFALFLPFAYELLAWMSTANPAQHRFARWFIQVPFVAIGIAALVTFAVVLLFGSPKLAWLIPIYFLAFACYAFLLFVEGRSWRADVKQSFRAAQIHRQVARDKRRIKYLKRLATEANQ